MSTTTTIHQQDADGQGQFYTGNNADSPTSAMMYHRWGGGDKINIDHTEVDESLRGQGAGLQLQRALVDWARQENLKVSATCPFAVTMFERYEDMADVLVAFEGV